MVWDSGFAIDVPRLLKGRHGAEMFTSICLDAIGGGSLLLSRLGGRVEPDVGCMEHVGTPQQR